MPDSKKKNDETRLTRGKFIGTISAIGALTLFPSLRAEAKDVPRDLRRLPPEIKVPVIVDPETRRIKKEESKKLMLKALVDPEFRKTLREKPEEALHVEKITDFEKHEIKLLLAVIEGIDYQINALSDEVLCNCTPPGVS